MTPTSFDFTVTMPGDNRLVGAIRELTRQAGGFARLPAEATNDLAGHVERATGDAIAATGAEDVPIAFRFSGTDEAVGVEISCDATPKADTPASTREGPVTVVWSAQGTRHTCRIRRRLPA